MANVESTGRSQVQTTSKLSQGITTTTANSNTIATVIPMKRSFNVMTKKVEKEDQYNRHRHEWLKKLRGNKYSLDGYKHNPNLVNMDVIGDHNHPEAIKVREILELFPELYTEFSSRRHQRDGQGDTSPIYMKVANRIEEMGLRNYPKKNFGHIPGIQVGDTFQFRSELRVVGLHNHSISGIDYVVVGGKKIATSIVNSGRYNNEPRASDVLIYSGQGGVSRVTKEISDQKLVNGNIALVHSMLMGYPVRVTSRRKGFGYNSSMRKDNYEFIYDGLYMVEKCLEGTGKNNKLVYKFELRRLPRQPRPRTVRKMSKLINCKEACVSDNKSPNQPKSQRQVVVACKPIKRKEVCILNDATDGKERRKVRVVNSVGTDRPLPFTYVTEMIYPYPFQFTINPIRCDCIDGCSDLRPCSCVSVNGGNIMFNKKGVIGTAQEKSLIHECGPWCRCPSTCKNRVSQHGPKHQFEIFKTESKSWALRSPDYIPSGSFICEYVGEVLLRDKTTGKSDYKWNISGEVTIDATKYGNIGRYITHSCSPNLYAQQVLYDHGDMRMPHVMFFASKNIPPRRQLTCNYNHGKID